MEICNVCGKRFYGEAINVHGSYDYINHTNFSHNIGVMFYRTKNITSENERIKAIVNEFFTDGNDTVNKKDAIEFLDCLKHYQKEDKNFLDKVTAAIQAKIDKIKNFTVCYMVTGGITIEAESEQEAREIFEDMDSKDLLDELEENAIEATEVFEEPEE